MANKNSNLGAAKTAKNDEFYTQYEDIEREMNYDEFMALYEQYPEFEDLDDEFICMEEQVTGRVAAYLDDHLLDFIDIVK